VNHGFDVGAAGRAWESTTTKTAETTTEEKETGHFSVKHNESLLFFDSEFYARAGLSYRDSLTQRAYRPLPNQAERLAQDARRA